MIDPDTFRSVLGRFASGVTVLTTVDAAGQDHGMTVSSFCSVSLEPPLVLACVDEAAEMRAVLRTVDYFGVSILSEDQEPLSRRFADADTERFEGVGFTRGSSGVALLDGAIAHLECRIEARHPAGDHTIIVGEVLEATALDQHPLIYFRSGYGSLGG